VLKVNEWSYVGSQIILDPGFCTGKHPRGVLHSVYIAHFLIVILTGISMRESSRAGLGRLETNYPSGFAIVMAESPSDIRKHLKGLPGE
jgi:hypothetical protein